jgi:surface carbohydrate biosynthesis protein
MNLIKIKNIILLIAKTKFQIQRPKISDILIFDYVGSNNFTKYLKNYNYDILHTRGEKINLFVTLKCFFNFKINFENYVNEYIKISKPKIVITFIDNNYFFYNLKKHNPKIKTIFVQNGIRSHFADIFGRKEILNKKEILAVDYMFTSNDIIGKKYNTFIKGKFLSIGYFKNNKYLINSNFKKKEILYISTHRNLELDKKIYGKYTWSDIIKNDEKFLNWLNFFCNSNRININILSRYSDHNESIKEKFYFDKFFDNYKFISGVNSYKIIDKYKYVITNDSTLGIENLARGGITAFICNRLNIYPFNTRKFGWMENFPKTGFFWTHHNNINEFSRVFNNIIFGNKKKIFKKINYYKKKIIAYDKDNKKFNLIIKKILGSKQDHSNYYK